MTSIAVKTAAVPAIVCSSAYRSNDGGTRPHPSGIGPGLLAKRRHIARPHREQGMSHDLAGEDRPGRQPGTRPESLRPAIRHLERPSCGSAASVPDPDPDQKPGKWRDLRIIECEPAKAMGIPGATISEAIGTNHLGA